MNEHAFGFQERIVFQLKSLFESYGFRQYKMNKFEEYDLYARNKDFLLSDSVITFTDFGGKLMALKPDVTLSIVKNSLDDSFGQQKLYYNENVYRVDSGGHSFKEMTQLGLETIGAVDDLCILEVLILAAKSLQAISDECVLDICHLGILSDALSAAGVSSARQDKAMKLIGEKSLHELKRFFSDCGIEPQKSDWMLQILSASGSPAKVLPVIRQLVSDTAAVDRLIMIFDALQGSGLEEIFRFDFSAVDDIRYYNGVVFKGYIHGLPASVLSGGQYDNLMRKMHRKSNAIGFAVYIDRLERLEPRKKRFDVDTVLLYDETVSLLDVMQYASSLRQNGVSVMVLRNKPDSISFRQMIKLHNGEVEKLENDA